MTAVMCNCNVQTSKLFNTFQKHQTILEVLSMLPQINPNYKTALSSTNWIQNSATSDRLLGSNHVQVRCVAALAFGEIGGRHGLRDRQEGDVSLSLATLTHNSTTSTTLIFWSFNASIKACEMFWWIVVWVDDCVHLSQTTNDWRISCNIEEADIKSAMSHSREDAPPLSGDRLRIGESRGRTARPSRSTKVRKWIDS